MVPRERTTGGEGGVGAAVEGEVDLSGKEFAVLADGGAVAGAAGMALGGGGHVFGAVVAELHRMAGLHREQRGVAADDGGEVFFAAEGSAGLGLDDAALFGGEVEDQLECVDEVEGHCIEPRTVTPRFGIVFGDNAVVLDVELLLRAGSVLAFDDEVGVLPDFVAESEFGSFASGRS